MSAYDHPSLSRQLIIVVGAPRSGTTWLAKMIGAHPQVAAIGSELRILYSYLLPVLKAYDHEEDNLMAGRWKQGLPLLFDRTEFERGVVHAVGSVYDKVLEKNPSATHVLDKHPDYALTMERVAHLIPHVRFVHIIRDGREAAVSMLSARRRVGFGEDTIEGAAQVWRRNVTQARKQGLKLGPDYYLELRYEDLRRSTQAELERVFRFVGLVNDIDQAHIIARDFDIKKKQVSSGDASLNELRDIPGAIWRERLILEQRMAFERIAGELLKELGYRQDDWWVTGSLDRLRSIYIPLRRRLRVSAKGWAKAWSDPWSRSW